MDMSTGMGPVSGLPPFFNTSTSPKKNEPVVVDEIDVQVIKFFDSLNILNEMKTIFSSGFDKVKENKSLLELNDKLIQPAPNPQNFDHSDWGNFIATLDTALKHSLGIQQSQDLGGHGGNLLVDAVLTHGEICHLFLKPYDEVEGRNYEIIKRHAPEVAKFMPHVYGAVTIEGKKYLVMENTRIDNKGNKLKQLVDAKIAGKLPSRPDFNPIADQNEIKTTRGYEKGYLDYAQMKLGADWSPDYMVYTGYKMFRIANFSSSEKNLIDSLAGVKLKELKELVLQLDQIKQAVEESPIAFIGASVIFVMDPQGKVKPIVIDPAHIQVDPDAKSRVENSFNEESDRSHIYFGNSQDYKDRKISNQTGFNALINTVIKQRVSIVALHLEE